MSRSHDGNGLGSLLDALPRPDWQLAAAGCVVFGVQRLVPNYQKSYEVWYPSLRKPKWNPKPWVFPAVWIPLKVLQSVAIWSVCKKAHRREDLILPCTVFGIHLLLGNMWNVVFFGRQQLEPSLKWMAAFYVSIAGTIAAFHKVDETAAKLMVPTQVWVTIAAILNYEIVRLNKGGPGGPSPKFPITN